MKHGFVGFSPQYGGSYTYYYWDDRVADALEQVKDTVNVWKQTASSLSRDWLHYCGGGMATS